MSEERSRERRGGARERARVAAPVRMLNIGYGNLLIASRVVAKARREKSGVSPSLVEPALWACSGSVTETAL